jgi:hypothetical protein
MKYFLAVAALILSLSSSQAMTCYDSLEELRQTDKTHHAYHTNKTQTGNVCWHTHKVKEAHVKKSIQKIASKPVKQIEKQIEPPQDIYRITPEQGQLLLDLLFPELPLRLIPQ